MLEKHLTSICRRFSTCSLTPTSSPKSNLIPSSRKDLFCRLQSILQECSGTYDLRKGQQAHAQAILNGASDFTSLQNRILGMYVLCRSFSDAKDLFLRMEKAVPLPWNWMIRGLLMMGKFEFVLLMYFKMWDRGLLPDKYTFTYVIKACCGLSAFRLGRSIHDSICSLGFEMDVFVGSSLIKMYTENGSIHDARDVFERMPEKDHVLWNAMIDGYMRCRCVAEAIVLFSSMRYSELGPNHASFASVLSICASEAMLEFGVQIHGLAVRYGVEFDSSVANTLLSMYSKCRCWSDMLKVFGTIPLVEKVTWNGIISGYVQNGFAKKALDSFHMMQASGVKPDSVTFTSLLPAFSSSAELNHGKEIHGYAIRNDVHLDAFFRSALIDIYFKCRNVKMACNIFYGTQNFDLVISSAMISGYVFNGMNLDALQMFHLFLQKRLKPNAVIVASVLPVCSCLANLRLGKELHCCAIKNDFEKRCYVASALTDMYSKCGRIDLGYNFFMKMSERDIVAWNSMISSFTQNARPEEAISLFRKMGLEGLGYDSVSISSALSACASLCALHYGKEIHCFMIRSVLASDIIAESALLDMYGKCGKLDLAQKVFDIMHRKNDVSWNSIISAYGIHGRVEDATILFHNMKKEGFQPDHLTFLSMLSACAHSGQIEEGLRYFKTMTEECALQPQNVHYACVVDMFGRAGLLYEALSFINSMPVEADAGVWGTLLGACRLHRNVQLAELASKHLFKLEPENSGYYVLMSNVHAVTGQWKGVRKVRSLMRERKVQKSPGCSWIDLNKSTHMFMTAEKVHPDSAEIYFCVDMLHLELKAEGYIPKTATAISLPS